MSYLQKIKYLLFYYYYYYYYIKSYRKHLKRQQVDLIVDI